MQAQKIDKQSKYFSISIDSRLDEYISGQSLVCLCLVPALKSTKIDLRSKDVGQKNRQKKQVFLSFYIE